MVKYVKAQTSPPRHHLPGDPAQLLIPPERILEPVPVEEMPNADRRRRFYRANKAVAFDLYHNLTGTEKKSIINRTWLVWKLSHLAPGNRGSPPHWM